MDFEDTSVVTVFDHSTGERENYVGLEVSGESFGLLAPRLTHNFSARFQKDSGHHVSKNQNVRSPYTGG